MSLIFIEGWNGYTNESDILTNNWIRNDNGPGFTTFNGCTSISISFGTRLGNTYQFRRTLPSNLASNNLICGSAIKVTVQLANTTMLRIGNSANQYIGFFQHSNGFIGGKADIAFGGESVISNVIPLTVNVPYYLEIQLTPTTATFRINGADLGTINLTSAIIPTNIDYYSTTTPMGSTGNIAYHADMYCCDELGDGPFNTLVGPIVVQKAAIIGTGTNVNFIGSHTDVDEIRNDNNTTKITGSEPNAKFTVKLSIPDDNILGYNFRTNAQSPLPNFLGVSMLEQLNSNEILSTPKLTTAGLSSYYWQHQVYREKLPGNVVLNKANIEAAEFGVKLIDMR